MIAARPLAARRSQQAALSLLFLLALILTGSTAPVRASTSSYEVDARYDVSLHLDWDTRRVRLDTTIGLLNSSGGPIDRLDLNTVAARLGSMRKLRVRVDGAEVRPRVVGQTIRVPLRAPLADGDSSTVRVAFRARLRTTTARRSYFFAQVGGVAQLYRFIPWVSRTIRFGSQAHGEPFLTPTSPSVQVTVSSDRRLVWATSGRRIARDSGRRARYVASDVRDFVIAASPTYRTARGASLDGRTRIVAHTRRADGRRLVDLARQELARYAKLTGVPYPYPTYTIAESGGGLAMEAPSLIWIPGARDAVDQPFLVSHETAHQWWYGIVGNDQSTDAFADEALADYFSRKARSSIRRSRCATDRLDLGIRRYSSVCYYEVIYIQGGRFLDRLRRDFGDRPFKRALRAYTAGYRFGIGGNAELLAAFRAEMGPAVEKRFRLRFPSLYP